MLRTRRPSSVTLSPPKPQKTKASSELPVYSVYLERARSDESETSSSSSFEESAEQVFASKIQETFPLCRKNPQKEIKERRKRWLLRAFLVGAALILVWRNLSLPAFRKSGAGNNTSINDYQNEVAPGRQLTYEAESARSLDSLISQSKIRQEAETMVFRTFGEGPFLVEFELRVWGDDNRPSKHFFTIELAPTVRVYDFLGTRSLTFLSLPSI